MRKGAWLSFVAAAALLAGCGGGGGDTRPEVAPPPPQPAPEPAPEPEPIHHLKTTRSFTALVASSEFTLKPGSTILTSEGHASTGTFSVRYHAPTDSYALITPDYTPIFTPDETHDPDGDPYAIHPYYDTYIIPGEERGWHQLNLFKTSMDGRTETQHVALGQWRERSTLSSEPDTSTFHTFVYGFEAPASAVPRTGNGSFKIDVYGTTASPGNSPKNFDGIGRFDIDFGAGSFSTYAKLIESWTLGEFVSGGPGYELSGAGKLSQTEGTFSGQITFSGSDGTIPATLNGKFYGPDASELGAIIFADDGKGTTVSGGLVGWRSTDLPGVNETLLNIAIPELFLTDGVHMTSPLIARDVWEEGVPYQSLGRFLLRPGGTVEIAQSGSNLFTSILKPSSIVASGKPNFTVYEQTEKQAATNIPDDRVRLELYKPGKANTELQLTYTSFGHWQSGPEGTDLANGDRVYFTYGFKTPGDALSARTGSAHYEGVAYGTGYNKGSQTRYEVSGTSRFDVNFSDRTYAGGMKIAGKTAGSASPVDFGSYQFGGALTGLNRIEAPMSRVGSSYPAGYLEADFYGPKGEEIGGTFTMNIEKGEPGGGTSIGGITVARQK